MNNKRIDQIFEQVIDEVCENPLHRFAELVAAAARLEEKEACAKFCIAKAQEWGSSALMDCASEIRKRTE